MGVHVATVTESILLSLSFYASGFNIICIYLDDKLSFYYINEPIAYYALHCTGNDDLLFTLLHYFLVNHKFCCLTFWLIICTLLGGTIYFLSILSEFGIQWKKSWFLKIMDLAQKLSIKKFNDYLFEFFVKILTVIF